MSGSLLQNLTKKNAIIRFFAKIISYTYLLIYTILGNGVTTVAGYLTYTTLLAIVPTVLVFFSVLSFLPHFDTLKEALQDIIFSVIAPNSQNELIEVFNNIIAKTSSLGLPSVISLFVIAFMLIRTIDNTINRNIWHINRKRKLLSSFTTYWTIISFGPMLLGALLFAKSYLLSVYKVDDSDFISSSILTLLNLTQVFILWWILFFSYVVFPMTKVKLHWGVLAATIATIALFYAKNIFIYYITTFPSYYVLYGALAAFPITVFWLYIVWVIILCGATLTKVLTDSSFFKMMYQYVLENNDSVKDNRIKRQIEDDLEQ